MTTPDTAPTTVAAAPSRTLSILSLVAALASIPLGHLFVLPIAAIILGFIARRREPAGRTLSLWGIIVGFVLLFWWVVAGAVAASFFFPLYLLHHMW